MPKAKKANYLITYEESGTTYKICRLVFSRDGSYHVTSPYHGAKKAVLLKKTVNYEEDTAEFDYDNALDVSLSDDEAGLIKLTHHRNGFVQFSGKGILSGKEPSTGQIRGVGVNSYPLTRPVRGPGFGLFFTGVDRFRILENTDEAFCTFRRMNLVGTSDPLQYCLEGYVLPALWSRFVYLLDGAPYIDICHPAGVVIHGRVVMPPADWEIPYLFPGFRVLRPSSQGATPSTLLYLWRSNGKSSEK